MSFESGRFSKSYEDKTEEAYFFKQYSSGNPQNSDSFQEDFCGYL
nr:hypothetical protein [uncultured Flavobacterium sp.]